MSGSREQILSKLRRRTPPFDVAPPPAAYRRMVPMADTSAATLAQRFVAEAEKLSCNVHQVADEDTAIAAILNIIDDESDSVATDSAGISCWDFAHIPLPGLAAALLAANISITPPGDPHTSIGITGAEAALAATGSLIMVDSPRRHRTTSLLPPTHIAIIRRRQIIPDLETWFSTQRGNDLAALRDNNITIISGSSRTADIAQELILGMHGPRTVHIILF